MTQSTQPRGKVLAIRGAVVDVAFQAGELPRLEEALIVEWDRPGALIVEVQAHLDERTVRGVALQATAGPQTRSTGARDRSSDHRAGRRSGSRSPPRRRRQRPRQRSATAGRYAAIAHPPNTPTTRRPKSGHRNIRNRHQDHRPSRAARRKAARLRCSAAPVSARPSW